MVILRCTMRLPTPSTCLGVSASMWSWRRPPRSSTPCTALTAPGACWLLLRGQRLAQQPLAMEGRCSGTGFLSPVPSLQSPVLNHGNGSCFFHAWLEGKNPCPGHRRHAFCPRPNQTDSPSVFLCHPCLRCGRAGTCLGWWGQWRGVCTRPCPSRGEGSRRDQVYRSCGADDGSAGPELSSEPGG